MKFKNTLSEINKVIEAFGAGKSVEYLHGDDWHYKYGDKWDFCSVSYRVKKVPPKVIRRYQNFDTGVFIELRLEHSIYRVVSGTEEGHALLYHEGLYTLEASLKYFNYLIEWDSSITPAP